MKLPLYQVDAFSERVFAGNPAAVCLLDDWLADEIMQGIAAENNLSETAFVVPRGNDFAIRWFTPRVEMDLCGHATLASAFVLWEASGIRAAAVTFDSRSGPLTITRGEDGLLSMDFPAWKPAPCPKPELLEEALGVPVRATLSSRDLLAILDDEELVRRLEPDMALLSGIPEHHAVIVSAASEAVDFVSRFFAPRLGIAEDPATGSAHCTLIPYWAAVLGKDELHARQLSPRGGELFCRNAGEQVVISGRAVLYLEGSIEVPK